MRPQHNAAENATIQHPLGLRRHASMRPQHNAAENGTLLCYQGFGLYASMRPQHNAAENPFVGTAIKDASVGFNEAAA